MKKIWKTIGRDLWTVLLDIIAVNAAWYFALVIRFYMTNKLENLDSYMGTFLSFAPFYTVLALLVFAAVRLDGGMWQFAGINDMNRIIGATAVTLAIQLFGTMVIFPPANHNRMSVTYYAIGIMLQFVMILLIRFGYRMLLVEKKKLAGRKTAVIPAIVIGAGETARKALIHLADTPFRVVAAADEKQAGKILNGVPVIADYSEKLEGVKAVFIADRKLDPEKREEIRKKCEEKGIEVQDYTGVLANISGRVPVASLLSLMSGPVTLRMEGQEKKYASGEEALKDLRESYEVGQIEGATVSLKKSGKAAYEGYDSWAKQHKEDTGEDVSFF